MFIPKTFNGLSGNNTEVANNKLTSLCYDLYQAQKMWYLIHYNGLTAALQQAANGKRDFVAKDIGFLLFDNSTQGNPTLHAFRDIISQNIVFTLNEDDKNAILKTIDERLEPLSKYTNPDTYVQTLNEIAAILSQNEITITDEQALSQSLAQGVVDSNQSVTTIDWDNVDLEIFIPNK